MRRNCFWLVSSLLLCGCFRFAVGFVITRVPTSCYPQRRVPIMGISNRSTRKNKRPIQSNVAHDKGTRRLQEQQSYSQSSPQKRRKRSSPAIVTPPPSRKRQSDAEKGESSTQRRRPRTKATLSSTVGKVVSDDTTSLVSRLVELPSCEQFLDLKVSPQELRPSKTLTTGQCFHWRATHDGSSSSSSVDRSPTTSAWGSHNATEWVGVLPINGNDTRLQHAVVAIQETPTTTLYRALYLPPGITQDVVGAVLREYFQLGTTLEQLYQEWSAACPRLACIAQCVPGVRVVQQDPWECLVSFLCSSNNNIPRITKMLNAIRQTYGTPLVTVPSSLFEHDHENNDTNFYSFPTLRTLSDRVTEEDLRTKCGMGYRAKYLVKTIEILEKLGGEEYLWGLRSLQDPTVVQQELCQFHGVGRKVADCVALFSLAQTQAIPVDVHVWNVARRDYDTDKTLSKAKSLTPSIYNQVGNLFRNKFPNHAGWAHSLLFVAELPSFRTLLPEELVEEMDKFREAERAKKKRAVQKQDTNIDG